MVLEYIAHAILKETAGHTLIPVVLNGTTVGSGLVGRECISIDFSHGGDPLDERVIRMAFSTYQWHRARPDIFGAEAAARPPLATVPARGRLAHDVSARRPRSPRRAGRRRGLPYDHADRQPWHRARAR